MKITPWGYTVLFTVEPLAPTWWLAHVGLNKYLLYI